MSKNDNRNRIISLVIIGVIIVMLFAYMVINPKFTNDDTMNDMIKTTVTRTLGTAVFIVLMIYLGYTKSLGLNPKGKGARYLPVLPFLLVVINNFPIIGMITGNTQIVRSGAAYFMLFTAENLAIALFEETAFRGTLFLYVLENRKDTTKKIFWVTVVTSLVFGCVHLLNLFEGGSPLGVILQIGYSFLIGGMCAIALLLTKNLWVCVLLHAVFDFGGKIVETLGKGKIWDAATVTVTAVLGILTVIHALFVMKNIKTEDADALYKQKEITLTENKTVTEEEK